jgi:hypothetical protein
VSKVRRVLAALAALAVALAIDAGKALDTAPGIFGLGWILIVAGLAMKSWSTAFVVGGALLVAVVLVGAIKK